MQALIGFAGDADGAEPAELIDHEGTPLQLTAVMAHRGPVVVEVFVERRGVTHLVRRRFGQKEVLELRILVERQSDAVGHRPGDSLFLERDDQLLGDELIAHQCEVLERVLGDDQHAGVVLAGPAADQVRVAGPGARVEQRASLFQDKQTESIAIVEERHPR